MSMVRKECRDMRIIATTQWDESSTELLSKDAEHSQMHFDEPD